MQPRHPRIPSWIPTSGRLVIASMKAWVRHRAPSKGAALAFYTLFSMAPILVLVMAVVGSFLGQEAVRGELFTQLQGLLGVTGAKVVQSIVVDAHLPGAGRTATVIASLLLVVGATSVFAELKDSLDDIWNVQTPVPTGLMAVLRARVLSFGMVLVLAFLLLVTLAVDTGLALTARLWEGLLLHSITVISATSQVFSFVVILGLFAVIYKMLPEVRLSWGDVAMGALCTATLFTLGKHAIGVYLGNSAVGSSFGAAGSVAALLVWVYYSAQVFFLGAEFTREYALTFGSLRGRARKLAPLTKSMPHRRGGRRDA